MALIRGAESDQPEYRWRVIEVAAVYNDGETIATGRVREYRTPEAATARENKLRAAGKQFVTQLGVVRWLTAEEEAIAYTANLTEGSPALRAETPGP